MSDFDQSQVVILSSIDWQTAWQRHHIFAVRLAEAGHDVFFVENSGFRDPRLQDLPRLWDKLRSWTSAAPPTAAENLPSRLRVISPRVLPPTRPLFRRLNAAHGIPRLLAALRDLGLRERPLVITYFPTATTLELIRELRPGALVYDYASNFRAHPSAPADFLRQEAELLARTDLVVCDSDALTEQKRREHSRVVQIHQGVPEEFFAAKPASGTWRSFCYYGTWSRDLDPAFLAALVEAGFSVTVSGFWKSPAPPLPPGVRRLDPTRREELVRRLEEFDAFIMPYKESPFVMAAVPAKIYECLAMGRPVIAIPMPCFAPLGNRVLTGATPREWVALARSLPAAETPELREARVALARRHTCDAEFSRLREELRRAWESSAGVF